MSAIYSPRTAPAAAACATACDPHKMSVVAAAADEGSSQATLPTVESTTPLKTAQQRLQTPNKAADTHSNETLQSAVAAAESSSVAAAAAQPTTSVSNVLIGKEYAVQATSALSPPGAANALAPNVNIPNMISVVPEKDTLLWYINDFSNFREAARLSQLPPLTSPAFGDGCKLRLELFDRSGHVSGRLELPLTKAAREGVAHFTLFVLRCDNRPILTRKVEMRSTAATQTRCKPEQQRFSRPIQLSQARLCRLPKWKHLTPNDTLRIRLTLQYFPFDAPVFVGGPAGGSGGPSGAAHAAFPPLHDMFADIRLYCQEDHTQSVEITVGDRSFHACRFLLCARSKRFRQLFSQPQRPRTNTAETRGSGELAAISLTDVDYETLEQLLTYIHMDGCSWFDLRPQGDDLLRQLNLLETANSFGVSSLCTALINILAAQVNSDNVMQLYEVAEKDMQQYSALLKACTTYMDSMPGSRVALMIRNSDCFKPPFVNED